MDTRSEVVKLSSLKNCFQTMVFGQDEIVKLNSDTFEVKLWKSMFDFLPWIFRIDIAHYWEGNGATCTFYFKSWDKEERFLIR
ncbi:Uncharacterised protein [Mycobacterium tuberculosis]|nr:Uncharacterised protein [Streptococcus pneumoniae]CIV53117.1 Uncharacterised protein [Streptococcus pneumoniae]CJD39761.1 Uncharacterised protein [Streptococcus pneumoniae]CKT90772.1 Uncharacterised protein [Mycobacterium tuberculosis]